ncbi:MAG: hypothetical protein ACUVT9_03415 [Candidatus Bathycorpusculaceae bacterium]
MKVKRAESTPRNFVFRLRTGEYEVEICGTRDEVLKTIEDLPSLTANLHRAFEDLKPKTVATLTVKAAEGAKEEAIMQKYPKILRAEKCDEAILRILETDWGKWRPRTVEELKEVLKANGLAYPGSSVARVLMGLVKKGLVRHWKTDAGYVYILAEKEALT